MFIADEIWRVFCIIYGNIGCFLLESYGHLTDRKWKSLIQDLPTGRQVLTSSIQNFV